MNALEDLLYRSLLVLMAVLVFMAAMFLGAHAGLSLAEMCHWNFEECAGRIAKQIK